jgi:hypothetical protein
MIPRMNLKLIDIVDSKNFGFQVHANQMGRKLKLRRENVSPESQHHGAARDGRSREVLEKLALDQSSNLCVCVCVCVCVYCSDHHEHHHQHHHLSVSLCVKQQQLS